MIDVIPGSMGDPGYVVRGKGNERSINSASHGAGRRMSRSAALKSIPEERWRSYLAERSVTLIGGALDEAPQAYKDIEAQDRAHGLGREAPQEETQVGLVRLRANPSFRHAGCERYRETLLSGARTGPLGPYSRSARASILRIYVKRRWMLASGTQSWEQDDGGI